MDLSSLTSMLLAYDADGNVVATLDYLVRPRADGRKMLVDFAAKEEANEALDNVEDPEGGVWHVDAAVGSKVWPERLSKASDFVIEKEGPEGHRRLLALVHRESGHRRERTAIEAAIAERLAEATQVAGGELHLRLDEYIELLADIVGRPDRPLKIDAEGRTLPTVDLQAQATRERLLGRPR